MISSLEKILKSTKKFPNKQLINSWKLLKFYCKKMEEYRLAINQKITNTKLYKSINSIGIELPLSKEECLELFTVKKKYTRSFKKKINKLPIW